MPEQIFNICDYKDLYWEIDSGNSWKLSHHNNATNDCFVCQKYKYAMIYIDINENEELEEIKDKSLIDKAKVYLNIDDTIDDYAPIICGSVVNGGFKRKL